MLFTREYGNREGPCLIFLHGFMGVGDDFIPIIEKLSSDFFCVSLDLPGHGLSKKLSFNTSEEYLSLINDAIKPFAPINPTLIGYSMGGRLVQALAPLYKTSKLIFISSGVLPIGDALIRKEKDEWLSQKLIKESFSSFLEKWYNAPLFVTLKNNTELYRNMIEKRKREDPNALAQTLKCLSPSSFFHQLDFSRPFLYLVGNEDQKYKDRTPLIKTKYSLATVSIANGASHAVHLEKPDFVADHIQQYHRCYHDRMD